MSEVYTGFAITVHAEFETYQFKYDENFVFVYKDQEEYELAIESIRKGLNLNKFILKCGLVQSIDSKLYYIDEDSSLSELHRLNCVFAFHAEDRRTFVKHNYDDTAPFNRFFQTKKISKD